MPQSHSTESGLPPEGLALVPPTGTKGQREASEPFKLASTTEGREARISSGSSATGPGGSVRAADIAIPLKGKLRSGRWRLRCTAHAGGSDDSLSIWDTDKGIAVKCFSGCTTEAIKRSLGIWRESSRPSVLPSLTAEPVDQDRLATFDYEYPNGSEAFKVLRTDKPDGSKTFAQQTGGEWKAHPAPRPLYRSQRIAEERDATVLVVEGEKTAHAAQALFPNMAVTTSSGGSKAAAKSDWRQLKGRNVIVWPDNDEPGRAYAHEVARLCGSAATVRMVSLHEILEKYSQSCDSFNTDDWDTHPNQAWPLISKKLRELAVK